MIRALVGSFVLLVAAHALAQDDAGRLYDEGVAALEAGESERALDLFRRAFELGPSTEHGLALAATLQQREQLTEAIDLYDRLLGGELGDLDADRTRAIEQARRQADRARAVLHVRVEGDALDVEIEERPVGTVRRGAALTLRLDPGTHRIRGGIDGHFGAPTSIELGRGEQREVTLTPPEVPMSVETGAESETGAVTGADTGTETGAGAGAGSESETDAGSGSVGPWIVLGLAAAPLAAGIATGVMFNERVDRAEAAGNHRDAQPHLDDARPLGRTANASFAIAGALALTGLIWGIVSRARRDDRRVEVGLGVVRGAF